MFGYIAANKPELKFKEYDIYRSYYCGLCKELKKSGGDIARMSLSYDMTFIYILLTALYEPATKRKKENCILHPVGRQQVRTNELAEYVADMSVLMTYYKCRDDWNDERKITSKALMTILGGKYKNIKKKYPVKVKYISGYMKKLDRGEKEKNYNIDDMSGAFGQILGEIFAIKCDEWENALRKMGFYLGKFIYLMDAYEDIEEDIKKHNYNPFMEMYKKQEFEEMAHTILIMMMAECSKEFEKLPVIQNAELLRNILYSGVWVRYDMVRKRRIAETERKENVKSI